MQAGRGRGVLVEGDPGQSLSRIGYAGQKRHEENVFTVALVQGLAVGGPLAVSRHFRSTKTTATTLERRATESHDVAGPITARHRLRIDIASEKIVGVLGR